MKLTTKFYGEIEIEEDQIINFPQGLPGFEEQRRFVYLKPEDSLFGSLQAVDLPELGFVVISPFIVCPDYHFDLDDQMAKDLGLSKLEEVLLLSIVTIPQGEPKEATANLQAPIVINTVNQRGAQVILAEMGYPLRCRIWAEESTEAAVTKD